LVAQALLVRGHAAFDDLAAYEVFIEEVVAYWRNRPAAARLAEERPALRALPSAAIPSYTTYYPVVRRWSTIRVAHRTYSVPSQLMGHTVAFYRPSTDSIVLPLFETFRDAESYHATLANETTHWIAHESRLARDFGTTRFGSESYAIEELVAELCRAPDYAARRCRVPR
jgi:hypothetical protein